jgi:tRNA dimethylallyltransferase
MKKSSRKVVAIVGPTASGKTSIGVAIAKKFNGEIVSADSRQIFCGLDIGTGKEGGPCGARQHSTSNTQHPINIQQPIVNNQSTSDIQHLNSGKMEVEEMDGSWSLNIEYLRRCVRCVDGIPQWMIDIVNPETEFSMFKYLELTRLAIEDIFSRGKLPVIVGGTGLYIQALIEGFALQQNQELNQNSVTPTPFDKLKMTDNYSREQLDNFSIEQLNDILRGIDPEKLKTIDKRNPHRLIRAIERAQTGMKPIKIKPNFEVLQIGVTWPREELYKRIDKRVDERFEVGMLEEVEGLIDAGVDPDWLIKLGLEYRTITDFVISNLKFKIQNQFKKSNLKINGLIENCPQGPDREKLPPPMAGSREGKIENWSEFEEMVQTLKFKIHQYARRQETWFRRFPEIVWENDIENIEKIAFKYLGL